MGVRINIDYQKDENDCHICTSHCKDQDGYPKIFRDKKIWKMSRWIYTQKHGHIPKGMEVRHKCDNPALQGFRLADTDCFCSGSTNKLECVRGRILA